nr:unnamed protein product [Digitaria exilis]
MVSSVLHSYNYTGPIHDWICSCRTEEFAAERDRLSDQRQNGRREGVRTRRRKVLKVQRQTSQWADSWKGGGVSMGSASDAAADLVPSCAPAHLASPI